MRHPARSTCRAWEKVLPASIVSVKPNRQLWKINLANQERWMAKPIRQLRQLRWWKKIDQELRTRGFHHMPTVHVVDDKWMLMPYINGHSADYGDIEQVKQVLLTLAQFHRAGRYMQTPLPPVVTSTLCERLYHRLCRFYQLLRTKPFVNHAERRFFLHYAPRFYQDGLAAWEKIRQSSILAITQYDYNNRMLCHRDLANHNWLFDQHQAVWLIDFDTASYDVQLGDLWQISSRILHEQNWSEQACHEMITMYERIRPLSNEEKQLLMLLFAYPNDFFRETEGLLLKGYPPQITFSYIERLANGRDRWKRQLRVFQSL